MCIIPNKKFAKVKYEIPKNVLKIKNIYMDPCLDFSYLRVLKNNLEENIEKIENMNKPSCEGVKTIWKHHYLLR